MYRCRRISRMDETNKILHRLLTVDTNLEILRYGLKLVYLVLFHHAYVYLRLGDDCAGLSSKKLLAAVRDCATKNILPAGIEYVILRLTLFHEL